jgi:transcriptional regulator with XRE-family HTH domain
MKEDTEIVGRRIAQRRQQLGMTQTDLAQRCGVNAITVSKWERGVVLPSRKMAALEGVLLAPATWILTGEFSLHMGAAQALEAKNAGERLQVDGKRLTDALSVVEQAAARGEPSLEQIKAVAEVLHLIRTECQYIQNFLPAVPSLFGVSDLSLPHVASGGAGEKKRRGPKRHRKWKDAGTPQA